MGQYYTIVNIDKKEFITPSKFGDGLKLLEFGSSANGTINYHTLKGCGITATQSIGHATDKNLMSNILLS